MKRAVLYVFMTVCMALGASLSAADTDQPFLAFEKFMKTVVNTDYPAMKTRLTRHTSEEAKSMLDRVTKAYRDKIKHETVSVSQKKFDRLQTVFKHFEPLFYKVSRTGLRAEVLVQGIDNLSRSESELTAIMLWEDNDWKYDKMAMLPMEKDLKREVHSWSIGEDEIEFDAILTGVGDEHVELMVVGLNKNGHTGAMLALQLLNGRMGKLLRVMQNDLREPAQISLKNMNFGMEQMFANRRDQDVYDVAANALKHLDELIRKFHREGVDLDFDQQRAYANAFDALDELVYVVKQLDLNGAPLAGKHADSLPALKELYVPMSQLSLDDMNYVKNMKRTLRERISEARERLIAKAKEAKQADQLKEIKVYVLDHSLDRDFR